MKQSKFATGSSGVKGVDKGYKGINATTAIDKSDKTYIADLIKLENDFLQIRKAIADPKIISFLLRPTIKDEIKLKLLLIGFDKLELSEISQKSIKVIAKNGRLYILNDICSSIEDLIAIELGEQKIELRLSHDLTNERLSEFKQNLESKLRRKTRIKTIIDNSIVCGYIIKYNKQEYNNSVYGKLTNIAHILRETTR